MMLSDKDISEDGRGEAGRTLPSDLPPVSPDVRSSDFSERMNVLTAHVGGPEELARRSGLSRRVIDKYRAGESDPSRERLVALARAGGVSVSWLAAGEGSMFVQQPSAPVDPTDEMAVVDEVIRQLSYRAAVRAYGKGKLTVDAVMTAAMEHGREEGWSPQQLARLARLREILKRKMRNLPEEHDTPR